MPDQGAIQAVGNAPHEEQTAHEGKGDEVGVSSRIIAHKEVNRVGG